MKIINSNSPVCSIEDIDFGSVFLFERLYYMKIVSDHIGNCVDLTNGELVYLPYNTIITPVNATLVIEQQ